MIRPLAGRVAIVTGAGGGIGEAIARRLAAEGAAVVVTDLEQAAADRVATEIGGHGFGGDLSDEPIAGRLIVETVTRHGQIDILINNAGGGILRPFLDHTPDTLRATIDRNLWTAVWCSWHALRVMKPAGYGRIVNIGADSVRNGLMDHAGYNAAKGGVHAMTTGLAREFAPHGITVNTIAPCIIQTRQVETVRATNPALVDECIAIVPLGRAGTEDEVAGMAAYLVGPEGGFVTGQVLSLNGGTTML